VFGGLAADSAVSTPSNRSTMARTSQQLSFPCRPFSNWNQTPMARDIDWAMRQNEGGPHPTRNTSL